MFLGAVGALAQALVLSQAGLGSAFAWLTGLGVLFFFFVCGALQGRLLPLLGSVVHYLFLFPLFQILIPIYAWSNTHDLSWGTRPAGESGEDKLRADAEKERKEFRSRALALWVTTNWVLAQVLSETSGGAAGGSAIAGASPGGGLRAIAASPALYWYAVGLGVALSVSIGARFVGCVLCVAYEALRVAWFRAYPLAAPPPPPPPPPRFPGAAPAPAGEVELEIANPLLQPGAAARAATGAGDGAARGAAAPEAGSEAAAPLRATAGGGGASGVGPRKGPLSSTPPTSEVAPAKLYAQWRLPAAQP